MTREQAIEQLRLCRTRLCEADRLVWVNANGFNAYRMEAYAHWLDACADFQKVVAA